MKSHSGQLLGIISHVLAVSLVLSIGGCLTACQTFKEIATSTAKQVATDIYVKENGKVKDAIIKAIDNKSEEWKEKGAEDDWSFYTLLALGAAGTGKGLKHIWDRDPKKKKA